MQTEIPTDGSESFGGDGVEAIWQQQWSRLCGAASPSSEATDVAALVEQLEQGASERARQAAAYQLAASDDLAALEALLSRFDSHPIERVRRAASYGVTAAVARETAAASSSTVTRALVAKLQAPFIPALGAVCGTPAVLHALAEASPSQQLLDTLGEFWERTVAEVEDYCAGVTTAELESYMGLGRYQTQMPVDFYVTDRRNALTEAIHAAGSIGCAAIRGGDE